ncbi:DUF7010 family protein [Lysobacter niastensis]|uniref:Uncharacterized protein n=1 Tax=Lysobacter niastensis TaxID=380629 RepID=A0ABS0B7Q9_9GAMM|nr:hypothetical protein [Lysobacter niastensis]MBF6025040.1 hypothetical protein [Lysobacter niastensis]
MGTDLDAAQADMRFGYYSGAPGIFASSAAWLAAAVVALQGSPKQAVWVLFAGGVLIHPVSVLLAKVLGRPGKHEPGNPLATLAIATTFWLIFSLPLAYGAAILRIEWFFPAMLLVIGGRYLTFGPLFGMRIYWVLGLALAVAGYLLGSARALPAVSAFVGATIEAVFAAAVLVLGRHEVRPGISFRPKPLGDTV